MTTKKIMALAKEKFDKDLTQEEAQAYLDHKLPIPDEALELVNGGTSCLYNEKCPNCGLSSMIKKQGGGRVCTACNYSY